MLNYPHYLGAAAQPHQYQQSETGLNIPGATPIPSGISHPIPAQLSPGHAGTIPFSPVASQFAPLQPSGSIMHGLTPAWGGLTPGYLDPLAFRHRGEGGETPFSNLTPGLGTIGGGHPMAGLIPSAQMQPLSSAPMQPVSAPQFNPMDPISGPPTPPNVARGGNPNDPFTAMSQRAGITNYINSLY